MHKGQMLIELMIALSVVMLTLVALVQISTKSLSNAGFSQKQAQAATLANKEMEVIRNTKNQSWDIFYSTVANITNSPISGTEYVKSIIYTKPDAQTVTVTVTVSWTEKGKIFSSKQNTILTKY